MRALLLAVGGLVLVLAGCSNTGGGSHSPPPVKKELLPGKWKNISEAAFFTGYDFAEDGSLKMHVHGMEKPFAGHFSWTVDHKLVVELKKTPEAEKEFRKAASAFKEHINKRIADKTLSDKAGPSWLSSVPDELPGKISFKASLSEQPKDKPALLIVSTEELGEQTFEKQAD
jgi:hypothetical protein